MAQSNPIRVFVVHDDPVALVGLRTAFARYPDLQVVGIDSETADKPICNHAAWTGSVDVVVADYDHGMQLARVTPRRAGGSEACRVVIVTANSRECEIRSALESGVRGYILVGCALDELAAGVRTVHRGQKYLSAQVSHRLADILAVEPLTVREEEVLCLVVEGLCNKDIGRRLGVALGTVKSHMKGIFDKLDVSSRTQAVCAAERRGLLRNCAQLERGVLQERTAIRKLTPKYGANRAANSLTMPGT